MSRKANVMMEIPPGHFQSLLDDLELDFPSSLHAWALLKTMEKWKAEDQMLTTKILALNGDYRTKLILFYNKRSDAPGVIGSAHKWSHTEDDEEAAIEALRNCDEFPWLVDGKGQLSALTEETNRVIERVVREKWQQYEIDYSYGGYLYWMPKEEALKMEVNVPHGAYLANLSVNHAKEINEHWMHSYPGSSFLVESCLRFNAAVGLFNSETHELMAWALQVYHGGVGMLETKLHHRKKGYGSVVLKAVSKEIAIRQMNPHMIINEDNIASRMLAEKTKFKLAYRCAWVEKL